MDISNKCISTLLEFLGAGAFWTAVGAVGTIVTLWFIYRQVSNARAVSAYELLRKEREEFQSSEMRAARTRLARSLLQRPIDYPYMEEDADKVLAYFENIGLMFRSNLAPSYFVWTMDCYYILPYWEALSGYIEWVRNTRNDQTYFIEFQHLHSNILKIERKATKKKVE